MFTMDWRHNRWLPPLFMALPFYTTYAAFLSFFHYAYLRYICSRTSIKTYQTHTICPIYCQESHPNKLEKKANSKHLTEYQRKNACLCKKASVTLFKTLDSIYPKISVLISVLPVRECPTTFPYTHTCSHIQYIHSTLHCQSHIWSLNNSSITTLLIYKANYLPPISFWKD